ncbi:MAG: RNB domain-containing ribonuclease, partial [Phycisphaerales bacterium]|nr:RNB domain-containing ribonuclease [Phycisphaerales bacterium]
MPSRFKKRLLTHLSHASYEPTEITLLAEELGVGPEDFKAFELAVREMESAGQLVYGDNRFVTLPPMGKELEGEFRRNPRGFGFIVPRQRTAHGDLFVPAGLTLDALTGDLVRAKVNETRRRPGDDRSPYTGEIIEIIERKQSAFTGELRKQGDTWLIYPDGKTLLDPVVVQDVSSKNAREGDKVVFEIMDYPEGDYLASGVITQVLGESGRPDVETQAVIEAYALPGPFPEACIDEARALTRAFDEEVGRAIEGGEGFDPAVRRDLRDTFILTIDPPDAKDYDDAISIERTEGGGFRLGVHIADVSHFVTPGTALDDEAKERANSVYLPRLVIPMLPEVLSNGICSLMEGVPRFCKSAFIEYDRDGNVRGQGFAATVIHSSKRLTYLEAQSLIEGDQKRAELHARTKPNYTPQVLDALKTMNDLAKRIEKRRFRHGMIHLDLP